MAHISSISTNLVTPLIHIAARLEPAVSAAMEECQRLCACTDSPAAASDAQTPSTSTQAPKRRRKDSNTTNGVTSDINNTRCAIRFALNECIQVAELANAVAEPQTHGTASHDTSATHHETIARANASTLSLSSHLVQLVCVSIAACCSLSEQRTSPAGVCDALEELLRDDMALLAAALQLLTQSRVKDAADEDSLEGCDRTRVMRGVGLLLCCASAFGDSRLAADIIALGSTALSFAVSVDSANPVGSTCEQHTQRVSLMVELLASSTLQAAPLSVDVIIPDVASTSQQQALCRASRDELKQGEHSWLAMTLSKCPKQVCAAKVCVCLVCEKIRLSELDLYC